MRFSKMLSAISAGVFTALIATPSFATTASFTKQKNPGYISIAGLNGTSRFGTLSGDFPTGTLNKTKTITSLQYVYGTYLNGSTQTIQICLTKAYSSVYEVCQDITSSTSGTASIFTGKVISAGKDIHVIHTLSGGTYPAAAPTTQDQITVTFSYN